jgi:hypothetical protein
MAMTTSGSMPGSPLPFETGKSATPKKFSLEPHAAMGQTAPVARKPKNPTTPFKAMSSLEVTGGAPTLTLEQYAYFCTERALWPNHRAETCAKYGLDEAAEDALHAHYGAAFTADPTAKSRFNEIRAQARRQLGG